MSLTYNVGNNLEENWYFNINAASVLHAKLILRTYTTIYHLYILFTYCCYCYCGSISLEALYMSLTYFWKRGSLQILIGWEFFDGISMTKFREKSVKKSAKYCNIRSFPALLFLHRIVLKLGLGCNVDDKLRELILIGFGFEK